MEKIEFESKPSGAGRCWPEIGQFVADEFGDLIWKYSEARYPHKDSRLKVKREYRGQGACQKIIWKIIVPDDFPDIILLRSGDKRPDYGRQDEIIYSPKN